jgi:hypothetical protein
LELQRSRRRRVRRVRRWRRRLLHPLRLLQRQLEVLTGEREKKLINNFKNNIDIIN